MEPFSVDANLLRVLLSSDVNIDVGRLLAVRVAAVNAGGRGLISLAGELLEAELPEGVSAGDELKLQVREITPQKVVLAIQSDQPQAQSAATPIPLVANLLVPMPQGGSLQVEERNGSRAVQLADGSHTVKLRYDAPHFGAIDMHFVLDAHGGLRVAMLVPNGPSLESAQEASPRLKDALTEAVGKAVALSIAPRREPLEVFA